MRRLNTPPAGAHARRKFHEARNESPLATQTLLEIQGLYRIEAELRDLPKQTAVPFVRKRAYPFFAASGSSSNPNKSHTGPKAKPEKPSTTPSNSGTSCSFKNRSSAATVPSCLKPSHKLSVDFGWDSDSSSQCRSRLHQRHPLTLLETCRI